MKTKGFTLIELLIVVAIIGILASIAIPNLLTALQKAKQKATMSDMRSLGAAVEFYVTDVRYVPQIPNGSVAALNADFFVPFFIKKIPLTDGWSTPFQWEHGDPYMDEYSLVSFGRHGQPGGPAGLPVIGGSYVVVSLADFANDIVFSNGIFTFNPVLKN